MTNKYITKAIKDSLQDLEDDLENDHGILALDIIEGHLEDGDALSTQTLSNTSFMNYLDAYAKLTKHAPANGNSYLSDLYQDELDDLEIRAYDHPSDPQLAQAIALLQTLVA